MRISTRATLTFAAVPLIIAIAGCGASTSAGAAPTPNGTSGAATVRITAADSGRTFLVATGARIEVALVPAGGSYDPPRSDNPAAVRAVNEHGGYPDTTTAVAEFAAVGPGRAHVVSQTDLACLHTMPRCLPAQREFTVSIVVR